MCGIFAHYVYKVELTHQQVIDLLFQGLALLEYRGLDSSGLQIQAYYDSAGGALDAPPPVVTSRAVGKVGDLRVRVQQSVQKDGLDVRRSARHYCSLAHTRWATHGCVSVRNAHPIASGEDADFTIVHNGMIENNKSLREFLVREGESFDTDTDTEAFAKLLKILYRRKQDQPQSFQKLVQSALQEIQGAYAMVITSRRYPGEMIACKRGGPLMFAVKSSEESEHTPYTRRSFRSLTPQDVCSASAYLECIISSDPHALSDHALDACALEDGDIVHFAQAGWSIVNADDEDEEPGALTRPLQQLDDFGLDLKHTRLRGFDHYMKKEIHEQPDALAMTMQGRVKPAVDGDALGCVTLGGIAPYVADILRSRRIICIGAASSYHACLAARPLLETLSDIPVMLELASDFLDRHVPIFRDDICIFVSQSGETADVLQALDYVKERGALCFGVTNGVSSPLAQKTDAGIYLHAGAEIGVASTKTYTCQVLALTLVALKLAENARSKQARAQAIIAALPALPARVEQALALDGRMRALALDLKDHRSLLFFGRSSGYATALEAAHKVKEVTQIHSEGILAGEMKHGPLALVGDAIPCIVIATRDSMHGKMLSIVQQLKARQGRLIVLATEGDTAMQELLQGAANSVLLELPAVAEELQPVINVVPMQLLSYHMAVAKHLDVDQPRSLTKSYSNAAY